MTGNSTAAHTPGPWVRDGFCLSTIIRCTAERGSPEAKHLCGDYEVIARCDGNNWDANARLIAAAPDLLHALEMVRDANRSDPIPDYALRTIDAAIAKATEGTA